MQEPNSETSVEREVGVPLALGIAFLPGLFVWLLLRSGHSTLARAIGFGWAAFLGLLFVLVSNIAPAPTSIEITPSEKVAEAAQKASRPLMPGEPDCRLTSETEGWGQIKTNAILTADRYAAAHNPRATFADADGDVLYQVDGPLKGKHALIIKNGQIALAQLVPLFDFCTPATELDAEGSLWKVVLAKLNGKEF